MRLMRLIDANAMYDRFVKQPSIYDATDLPDMLKEMPTVEAISIEWLKHKYKENDPDGGNEDFDRYLWDSICYVLTAWYKDQEEEEWDSLSEIQYQRFLHL